MNILMVLTSHDQLGDTGKKLASGWKNLLHPTTSSKMRALT
jgi:hypothetical protein